jgi:ATP-dependent Clp protease adaptor protein ClpS
MSTQVVENTSSKTRLMPLYKVLLHNDDVNDMMHVTEVLIKVFKFDVPQCISIMLEAHQSGVALCKIEPHEYAELHKDQMNSLGLTATIEPE